MTELQHGFTCYWIIEDFCIDRNDRSYEIKSQIFYVSMLRDSTWYLRLDHRLFKPLGLFLVKDGPTGNSNIDLEMSILMTNGWNTLVKDYCKGMNQNSVGKGTYKLIKWDEHTSVKGYLLNGKLTISCHMSNGATRERYEQCVMTSRMISNTRIVHKSMQKFTSLKPCDLLKMIEDDTFVMPWQPPLPTDLLPRALLLPTFVFKDVKSTQTDKTEDSNVFNDLEDILKLFREKKFRYVTLRTATKAYAVHKALLCARSPVFNAMFQGRMKEDESSIVDINDIEPDTLFQLMQFLHLEPIGDLAWDAAIKLYYAADKYQIELLKKECRSLLKDNLSDENICEIFEFADTHQDEELQEIAQEYFCKNSRFILRSAEWTDLLYNRADLASEILYKLAENL